MKKLAYILIILLIIACNGTSKTKEIVSNKAKNTPEVQKMLSAFNKQKHRLEFNACEMLYNNKPFKLGMTIKELVSVFGVYDFSNNNYHSTYFSWKDIGIVVSMNEVIISDTAPITFIYIYMNINPDLEETTDLKKHTLNLKTDYFLIEGMPVNKDMMFKDFIDNSNYDLNDFAISDRNYKNTLLCEKTNINTVYTLNLPGGWNYNGAGHLRFKDKPNTNNTHVIEYISLHIQEKKE